MNTKKNWAAFHDHMILEAALYHETNGLTTQITDSLSVHNRFVEFKKYILRGSMTLAQLENRVYGCNGIMPDINSPSFQFLDSLEELTKIEQERKRNRDGKREEKKEE